MPTIIIKKIQIKTIIKYYLAPIGMAITKCILCVCVCV